MTSIERFSVADDAILVPAPEFALIPLEEGVLVEGGREPELLTGPDAILILPVLLPLLDGTRSVADVIVQMPQVPARHTRELVSRLKSWGVLREAIQQAPAASGLQQTLGFLRRTEAVYDSEGTCSKLVAVHIVVVSSGATCMGRDLAEGLRDNGFSSVQLVTCAELDACPSSADELIVSVLDGCTRGAEAAEHYRTLQRRGSAFLRTVLLHDEQVGEIGPVFAPDSTLCQTCLLQERHEECNQSTSRCGVEGHLWSALLATEVTAQLLHESRPGPQAFRRYHLPHFESELFTWPTSSACHHVPAADGSAPGPRRLSQSLPLLFEEAIARRQETANTLGGASYGDKPAAPTKLLLNCEWFPLPDASIGLNDRVTALLLRQTTKAKRDFTIDDLASVLSLSVGVKELTEQGVKRWAPSGGNLGSVEAYVIIQNLDPLPPGVYFYDPGKHALAKLERHQRDMAQAAFRSALLDGTASALLVLTGAYQRIGRKYGAFAYKLSHLDTGAASSQLLLVASALGVRADPVRAWDARGLSEALGMRSTQEVVTQVFRLGGSNLLQSGRSSVLPHSGLREDPHRLSGVSSADELVASLIDSTPEVKERIPPDWKPTVSRGAKRLLQRIFDGRHAKTLGGALNQRSSVRSFAPRPLTAADVQTLLRTALANNILADSGLIASVFVQNVTGLAAGVYTYDAMSDLLVKERAALPQKRVSSLFFQPGYAQCPFIVWFSGDVAAAHLKNAGGYQTLLVRSGLLGHRLWMAAIVLELSGVLLAGITSEAASKADQVIDGRSSSLLAFLCGYPADVTGADPA